MSPTDTPAFSAEPPAPRTLDVAGAVAMMDNSTELYQDIAQAYLLETAELGARLNQLLQAADLSEAARTLHTAKGLSLTVGAHLLANVCKQFETRIKSLTQEGGTLGASERAALQSTLDQATDATRVALQAALAGMASPPPGADAAAQAPDARALVADLEMLRTLLAASDMQALDWHTVLCARYHGEKNRLQALNQAIKVFDFAQAVVQCDELICNFRDPNRR